MSVILYLSDIIIPLIILCLIVNGLLMKLDIFSIFLDGAKEGLGLAVHILPTLIGLLTAIGVMKASHIFDMIGNILGPLLEWADLVPEVVTLMIVKLFSSSAATGMMLDIFTTYGVDSRYGLLSALMLSCTESCVYTMSVYFMAVKITDTRWTLAGALTATFAGMIASILLVGLM